MDCYICATCGTQYPPSYQLPAECPICLDERQYVGWKGQQWTTLNQLRAEHHSVIREEEPGLTGIGCEPSFAIGQRAQLVQTPAGNLLWECQALIDDQAIEAVRARGGLKAIAISHPHYYSSMIEWSQAFGGAPIYLHAAERPWVMRPDPAVVFWEGEMRPLFGGLTLIRCGGHFAGAQVLHWPAGAEWRGALLAGDILNVVNDRRWLSFMYSYPNLIPLNASTVRRMAAAVEPFAVDRIYSAWFDKTMAADAKAAVGRSVERYLRAIEG
jgi:glyoxylase-like metal-dependent hydrolase (beta-lactamase superfamily II)